MTGRRALALFAFVQMLTVRQSSLAGGCRGGATGCAGGAAAGAAPGAPGAPPRPGAAPRPRPPPPPAVHDGPNALALNTPSHLAAGCGAFQRFSPTGGAANGTPLKMRTVGCTVPVTPSISPVSMRSCSGII